MSGFVTLLGAGPGDPGLLTLKGRKAISTAEVVVYDRLVGSAILAMIPETAEAINVGKQASNHLVPQEEINQILLNKALEGKNVLRLKGGDSFVFGRGGEELELLVEHNIPFQVIPGITSAIAASCYGGIPVTHRDYCSSFHVITGHARAGKALEIDFEALTRTKGTLIFLMGVSAMPAICAGLLAAGMSPDMPAAMVEKGTTPSQKKVVATVGTLPQAAAEAGIASPAIIIVGKVCTLSDDFDWFSKLPLKGLPVVVTRPKERIGKLARKLRALGADVTEYPCIETVARIPCPGMETALQNLADYEWLVFTSPAGVDAFWQCLQKLGKDGRYLAGIKLATIGGGTAKELAVHGLSTDYTPEVYDGIHLGQGLADRATGKVLFLRAAIGSQELTDILTERKVAFDDIAVYDTIYENPKSEELRTQVETGECQLVTFTSASTVKGFVHSVGEGADLSKMLGVCIGEQTQREAESHGIKTIVAKKATIPALIDCIKDWAQENEKEL